MIPEYVSTDLQLTKIRLAKGERHDVKIRNHPDITVRVSARDASFRSKITDPTSGRRIVITHGRVSQGMTIAGAVKNLIKIRSQGYSDTSNLYITEIIEDFYKDHVNDLKRPDVVKDIFDRLIVPNLKARPLNKIDTYSLSKLIEKIRRTNGVEPARKSLGYIKKFFRWCTGTGRLRGSNPATQLSADIFKLKQGRRERHLTREEVPKLLDAIRASSMDDRTKLGLLILLKSGVRTCELSLAKWSDLDINNGLWFIPSSNTKNGQSYTVPLSPQLIEHFKCLYRITADQDRILGGLSRLAMTRALSRIQQTNKSGVRLLDLEHKLTAHDLRRSFSTFLSELGVAPHVVEKMLNHTLQGVMRVYNQSELIEERRTAISLLSDALENPLEKLPKKGTPVETFESKIR